MSDPLFLLEPVNAGVLRVLDAQGRPVGALKLIGAQWKFKAIGTTPEGELIPGGGPFTEHHNQTVAGPDVASVSAVLAVGAGIQATASRP